MEETIDGLFAFKIPEFTPASIQGTKNELIQYKSNILITKNPKGTDRDF